MKKIIAFDLDDTLYVTKSPIAERMANLLTKLFAKGELCVLMQLQLKASSLRLTHLNDHWA